MAEMTVELVAVERRLWSGKAKFVVARTTEGEIGILPRHIPVLAELIQGEMVRIDTVDGEEIHAAVHGGFLSVTEDGVTILAESAELRDEIDVERARAELGSEDEEVDLRARARLRAAGHWVP
ncbi:MAG: F0F1 ATP synthase subunit epsilon [Sciscionella sp.]